MSFPRPALLVTAALAVLLPLGAPLGADDAAPLAWKFSADTKRIYQVDHTVDQSMVGMPMKMAIAINQEMSEEVVKAEGANGTIKWNLDHVMVKANLGPMGKLDYDSARPEDKGKETEHPLLKQLVPLINKSITYTVDARGKVLQVGGTDGKLPEGLDAASVNHLVEDLHPVFPDHALKQGETWQAEMEVPLPQLGTAIRTRTFTFQGVETKDGKKVARLTVAEVMKGKDARKAPNEGLVDPDPENPGEKKDDEGGEEGGGMKLGGLKGEGKGEIWFLVDEGYILEATSESNMEVEISMGGQKIVQQTVEKTSRKFKK